MEQLLSEVRSTESQKELRQILAAAKAGALSDADLAERLQSFALQSGTQGAHWRGSHTSRVVLAGLGVLIVTGLVIVLVKCRGGNSSCAKAENENPWDPNRCYPMSDGTFTCNPY